MHRIAALTALGLLALAAAPLLADDADHMLLPGDRLRTQLGAGDERHVAVAAIEGSAVTLQAKRIGRVGVEPSILVISPSGERLDLGKRLKRSRKRALAKKVPIDATGVWRVGVSAIAGGGDVELTVKVKTARKLKITGELADEDAIWETSLPALPGTQVSATVKSKGNPRFTPSIEILAPDGSVLLAPTKAPRPTAVLPDLGNYTIRVRGGPGTFRGLVSIAPPNTAGRSPAFVDVEALPDIVAVSPGVLQNDGVVNVLVEGVGFLPGQIVTISDGDRGLAQGAIGEFQPTEITSQLDLTGVPAGDYTIGVVTPFGNSVTAPGTVSVTNRPPALLLVSAPEIPAATALELTVTGRGLDPDCELLLRRRDDGFVLPLEISSRIGPTSIKADVVVPPFEVGEYDVITTDPAGESRTFHAPLQVVGFRSTPQSIFALSGASVYLAGNPRSAAVDSENDRILVALVVGARARFLLLDANTYSVLSSYNAPSSTFGHLHPKVAWDAVNQVWAMTWVRRGSGTDEAFVRVTAGDDLTDELSMTRLAIDNDISMCSVATNTATGGFVAVWDQYDNKDGAELKTQFIEPGVEPDLTQQSVLYSHEAGVIFDPVIAFKSDGLFVVAFVGADTTGFAYAVRRSVVHGDGTVATGSIILASSGDWFDLFQPELAVNPTDGSLLLVFSYVLETTFHPAYVALTGGLVNTNGSVTTLDASGKLPIGLIDSVVWSAERGEYVTAMSNVAGNVAIRRIDENGVMRPAYVLEEHEGYWGILYSGTESGEMGLIRTMDGLEDGRTNISRDEMEVRVGPLR